MRKNDVEIGGKYTVRVSGVLQTVRITEESPYGGWNGVNEATGRSVRLRTAGRLRKAVVSRKMDPCGDCKGSGSKDGKDCEVCGGFGQYEH